MSHRCSLQCILPPGLLLKFAREGSPELRETALRTLALDHSFRTTRAEQAGRQALVAVAPAPGAGVAGSPRRYIYDQKSSDVQQLGTLVRSEGQPPAADQAINDAYDAFGDTYKFYWDILHRNSIDDQGMPIYGLVHYSQAYPNAFWDGAGHMWFGDGDGQMLTQTTKGIDVVGHELTHGVTQYTLNLAYQDQSGALNESISDCMGSLVMQYAKGQSADQASWLIGADIVGPELQPALRSMKDPGHANPHDDQPATMDNYVQTGDDNGGVHTNSGIPNKAFYVVATTIGGNAWEGAGVIWYDTMHDTSIPNTATFEQFAAGTLKAAQTRYGMQSSQANAVKAGWDAVKVPV